MALKDGGQRSGEVSLDCNVNFVLFRTSATKDVKMSNKIGGVSDKRHCR